MNKTIQEACTNYTQLISISIVCITLLVAYYFYIDYQVRMATNRVTKSNKITIQVLAAGFTAMYAIMLLPTSKEALDFQVYGIRIELYAITKAIIFLIALGLGSVTGGNALSKLIKGKSDE